MSKNRKNPESNGSLKLREREKREERMKEEAIRLINDYTAYSHFR